MKKVILAFASAIALPTVSASAQTAAPGAHSMVAPADIKWSAAAGLPQGVQTAVLFGDPAKEGPFVIRLKFPAGYKMPPHSHPTAEMVTVVSGNVRMGKGNVADAAKAVAMPAGSFLAHEAGEVHYGHVDLETVVQINGTGPWGIAYVNPSDDPRQRK